MAAERPCFKCGEKTALNLRTAGVQIPLCISCMDKWDREMAKAFATFVGKPLPKAERRLEPLPPRIDEWDGELPALPAKTKGAA